MSLRKFTSITALILITALMICALSACGAPAVDKESAVESAPIASAEYNRYRHYSGGAD